MSEFISRLTSNTNERPQSSLESSLERKANEKEISREVIELFRQKISSHNESMLTVVQLERSVVKQGIHYLVDKYGADKFLLAMGLVDLPFDNRNGGPPTTTHNPDLKHPRPETMRDLIENIDLSKQAWVDMADTIDNESLAEVGERLNETVGGVSSISNSLDGLERGRSSLGDTEEVRDSFSSLVGSSELYRVFKNYPDVFARFRLSEDIFQLLKDIRDKCDEEYTSLSAEFNEIVQAIEELVARRESIVLEKQRVSETIYNEEIITLENRLINTQNIQVSAMIRGILDKRHAERKTADEDFAKQLSEVHDLVLTELNAGNINMSKPGPLLKTKLVYKPQDYVERETN